MFPNALSSATHGIQYNLQRFAIAADRISNPDTDAGIKEIIEMKKAEQGIKVNAAVIRTVNDMSGYLLDVIV